MKKRLPTRKATNRTNRSTKGRNKRRRKARKNRRNPDKTYKITLEVSISNSIVPFGGDHWLLSEIKDALEERFTDLSPTPRLISIKENR